MKDEYVVYGKHDTECTMRYADGKPMEKLVNVFHTKDEAFFLASHLQSKNWYDIRIVAHVGYGSPKELADMFRQSVKV